MALKTVSTIEQTRNKMVTNYSLKNLILGDNAFTSATYTGSGAGSTIEEGSLMGRIQATQKVVLLDPAAVDGSQFPVGIALEDITVTAGASVTVNMVNKGRVALDGLTLAAGVALTDNVDGRTLTDQINLLGISLLGGTELTGYDNV